jgi:hypothetical protein
MNKMNKMAIQPPPSGEHEDNPTDVAGFTASVLAKIIKGSSDSITPLDFGGAQGVQRLDLIVLNTKYRDILRRIVEKNSADANGQTALDRIEEALAAAIREGIQRPFNVSTQYNGLEYIDENHPGHEVMWSAICRAVDPDNRYGEMSDEDKLAVEKATSSLAELFPHKMAMRVGASGMILIVDGKEVAKFGELASVTYW